MTVSRIYFKAKEKEKVRELLCMKRYDTDGLGTAPLAKLTHDIDEEISRLLLVFLEEYFSGQLHRGHERDWTDVFSPTKSYESQRVEIF